MLEDFGKYAVEIENGLKQDKGWPEIIPFDTPAKTDDFILEVLPEPVNHFCQALCRSLCVRPGLVGPLALGVLATVFQRRFTIQGKSDWLQPLSLYTIVSAPPSAGKSPALDALLKPLRAWEMDKREEEGPVIASARSERKILENRLAALEKSVATKRGNDAHIDEMEAKAISEQLARTEEPQETVLFTGDSTEEALVSLLEKQGGVLTLASDEGGFLANLQGRYKAIPDLDCILQAYSGSEVRVHRISRGAMIIPNPRLSILLCCQPSSLREFLGNPLFTGRGLTARFLYSQPEPYQGRRTVDAPPVPQSVADEYCRFMLERMDSDDTGIITLSPEAWGLFVTIVDEIEAPEAASEIWDGWRGKYRGALLRVAGILHAGFTERPTESPVSEITMAAACEVMDFFRQQLEALLRGVGETQNERDALYLLERVKGTTQLTKRELQRKAKRFRKAVDLDGPLRELESRGCIRVERVVAAGRPSEIIQVNPLLW